MESDKILSYTIGIYFNKFECRNILIKVQSFTSKTTKKLLKLKGENHNSTNILHFSLLQYFPICDNKRAGIGKLRVC